MPGWYDDPQDAQGQRYWDGQQWTPHHQRKPISQPPPPTGPHSQAAPPPPGVPPSPYQQAPWRPPGGGPPKKSWTPRVVAAVIGAVAVIAVVGWLASPTSAPPSTGHQDSPSTGHQDSPSTGDQDSPVAGHTKSYQAGYWWAYRSNMGGAALLEGAEMVCTTNVGQEAPVQGLNTEEWTQGCEDSFKKMGKN
jgi:hypothetical protein